jgi:thiol reductant ABC exporter CydD subunit
VTPGPSPRPVAGRLLARDRAARAWLLAAVLAGVGAAVSLLVQLAAVALVVADVFLAGGRLEEQVPLLGVAFVMLAVRAGLVVLREVAARRAAERLVGTVRGELTDQLLRLGPAWLDDERSGELGGVLVGGLETLEEYVASYLPARWLAMVVPVLVLLVVLLLDPPSVAVLLFTGPLLLLLLVVIGGRTREVTERRFLEMRTLSAFFLDILRGLPTLRMFGRSREQVENLRRISARYGEATMDVLRIAFQTSLVLEWGATIAIALIAVEVGLRLLVDGIAFDRALAVLLITPEFFLPLRVLAMRFHLGTAGKAATARVFEILDEPAARTSVRPTPERTRAAEPARTRAAELMLTGPPEIVFDAVTYRYPTRDQAALEAVSFRVPAGRSVALVGASGAGKSTTASLLLRFMEPSEGRITADGRRLTDVSPETWRASLAWVPQRPHLFVGSVADNIRLARPDAHDDAVAAAARAANAAAFIERLPDGYETLLGEAGARLSGGQRQRLAIARAFLRDAPLLVLDEATSYQDETSEAAIAESIARLSIGRTVLVIAHRLRLAALADAVVVLEAGWIVESGAPADLLAHGGVYARLVTDQVAARGPRSPDATLGAGGDRTPVGRAP